MPRETVDPLKRETTSGMRNISGACLAIFWLLGAALPAQGPLPEEKPQSEAAIEAPAEEPGEAPAAEPVPTPADKPDVEPEAGTPPATEIPKPDDKPSPAESPDGTPETGGPKPPEKPTPPPPQTPAEDAVPPKPVTPPVIPIENEDDATYKACTAALTAMGATFQEQKRVDDGNGCGMDRPITVTRLSPSVALQPEGTFRCETALQLARMTRDMIVPTANLSLPDMGALKAVNHASGYVCRNRNSAETGKMSEHARGNAVDIAALTFEGGAVPMVIAKQDDGTLPAAFQRSLNAFACLYFTTVLSPGSDAAHQDHLHLDVIKRKSGFRYCR
jgi:hypothetical protein